MSPDQPERAVARRPTRRPRTVSATGLGRLLVLTILVAISIAAFLSVGPGTAVRSSQSPSAIVPTATPSASVALAGGPTASDEGSTTRMPVTPLLSQPPGSVVAVPRVRHVWLIVLENKPYDAIVGNKQAPYLNDLIAKGGLATQYQALAHPSQPNYIALFSGSTLGVGDDHPHDLTARTLADQLEQAGRTWHVYAENVPDGCAMQSVASGGLDGSGTYARKHEPAISFTSISGDKARCASHIGPLSQFDPNAADLSIIVPNLCNDMHDCKVPTGDTWAASFVPRILGSQAYKDGGMLFITWDEGVDSTTPPNLVATIVDSPLVAPGTRSAVPHTHYSLLRTIQTALGVQCIANSCAANTLGELFKPTGLG